jgi:hypothetical protein
LRRGSRKRDDDNMSKKTIGLLGKVVPDTTKGKILPVAVDIVPNTTESRILPRAKFLEKGKRLVEA